MPSGTLFRKGSCDTWLVKLENIHTSCATHNYVVKLMANEIDFKDLGQGN